MKKGVLLILGILFLLPASGAALERFDIVTTQQLSEMLADRAAGKTDFLLVNALDGIIFRDAALPGSVNIPWSRLAELSDRLGADRDRLIVTY